MVTNHSTQTSSEQILPLINLCSFRKRFHEFPLNIFTKTDFFFFLSFEICFSKLSPEILQNQF